MCYSSVHYNIHVYIHTVYSVHVHVHCIYSVHVHVQLQLTFCVSVNLTRVNKKLMFRISSTTVVFNWAFSILVVALKFNCV